MSHSWIVDGCYRDALLDLLSIHLLQLFLDLYCSHWTLNGVCKGISSNFTDTQPKKFDCKGISYTRFLLDYSFNVFIKVYILVAVWKFYWPTFTSKLFSFVFCSPILKLLLCAFLHAIQYSSFLRSFLQLKNNISIFCDYGLW